MSSLVKNLSEEVMDLSKKLMTETVIINDEKIVKRVGYNIEQQCNGSRTLLTNNKAERVPPILRAPRKLSPTQPPQVQFLKTNPATKFQKLLQKKKPVYETTKTRRNISVNTTLTGAVCSDRLRGGGKFGIKPNRWVQTISKTMFTLDKASALTIDILSCGTQIFDNGSGKKSDVITQSQGTLCSDLLKEAKSVLTSADKYTFIRPVSPKVNTNIVTNKIRWSVSPRPIRGPDF